MRIFNDEQMLKCFVIWPVAHENEHSDTIDKNVVDISGLNHNVLKPNPENFMSIFYQLRKL